MATLTESLATADGALEEAHECAEARGSGSAALHERIDVERRRRVLLAVRSTLEQRAAETRLLYLLQTQREALEASALELAAVRRAAAVEREEPGLEAAWLRTPPPTPSKTPTKNGEAEEEPDWLRSASGVLSAGERELLRRDEVYEELRRDWLTAMAHSL